MRKINRGGKPQRSAGKGRTDRTSKPGFRPKGNNAGSPRRTSRSDDSEEGGGYRRSEGSERRGPSATGRRPGGFRSTDRESDRPSRAGSSAGRTGRSFSSRSNAEGGDRPFRRTREEDSESPRPRRTVSKDRYERPSAPRSRREEGDRPFRRTREEDSESPRPRRTVSKDRYERPSAPGSRREEGDRPFRRTREEDSESPRPRRTGSSDRYTPREEGDRPVRRSRSDDSDSPRSSRPGSRARSERPASPRGRRTDGERPSGRFKSGGRPFSDSRRSDFRRGGDKPFRKSSRSQSEAKDDGLTRLNKFIANCGICSRREADDLIKAGVITVNGHVITEMGYKVNPGDEVRYNNEILRGERPVYLLLNKPKDYITTVDDPGQRHTVMELVAGACKERIYPVGRLDRNTTGVLLFTNDGDLARKLMHPSFHVQKVYHVSLESSLKPDEMDRILNGIHLEDGPIKADDIAYAGEGNDRKEIGIELHSGRNRIVRRIFEFFGHDVVKLDRTVFAGLTKKDLPRGRWRFLSEMEVNRLKMVVGDKKLRGAAAYQQEDIEE